MPYEISNYPCGLFFFSTHVASFQVAAGSMTVLAVGPGTSYVWDIRDHDSLMGGEYGVKTGPEAVVDKITSHLKLL